MDMKVTQEDIGLIGENLKMLMRHYQSSLNNMAVSVRVVQIVERIRDECRCSAEEAFEIAVNELRKDGTDLTVESLKRRYYRMMK